MLTEFPFHNGVADRVLRLNLPIIMLDAVVWRSACMAVPCARCISP